MITIEEAQTRRNATVLYENRERGIITGVNALNQIMVRYGNDTWAKATPAYKLVLVHQLTPPRRYHRGKKPTLCTITDNSCQRHHNWLVSCTCGDQFLGARKMDATGRSEAHLRENSA